MCLVLASALFGTWLGLTIVFQFMGPSPRWIRHHKLIPKNVIPKWTFFAPSPGRVDYRIVVQDYRTEAEPLGKIREFPLHVSRSAVHAFWNPDKRRRKAIFDFAQLLQQLQQERLQEPSLGVQMTMPYLAILNVIMAMRPISPGAQYRRFLIVYTAGFDGSVTPVPSFVSSFHRFQEENRLDD
jgi:hypothetical protein